MSAISEYHDALAHYLNLKAQQPEEAELPDPDFTRASWAVERTFKAAVGEAIGVSSRTGAF